MKSNCLILTLFLSSLAATSPIDIDIGKVLREVGCAVVLCREGTTCISSHETGGPICVEEHFCGGFIGIACPSGLRCIDDPRDSCDPKKGGADCGGICIPDNKLPEPCTAR